MADPNQMPALVATLTRLARAQVPLAAMQRTADQTTLGDIAALRRLLDDLEALKG